MNKGDQVFGRDQKLKSRKSIGKLFAEGESLFSYPIKCIYTFHSPDDKVLVPKVATVVPKRNIKKAVGRNLLKRRIREAYRLNSSDLIKNVDSNLEMALIFIGKSEEPFPKIERSIQYILKKILN